MLRILRNLIPLFIGIFSPLHGYAGVTDCQNKWSRPSHQTMRVDSATSYVLTEYKSSERYFSVKQNPGKNIEIYYLNGIVLVKGYDKESGEILSQAQIEQSFHKELFWMPMVFFIPTMILAEAAPEGPCNIKARTPISIQWSDGAVRLQDQKITGAMGQFYPSSIAEISYEADVSIDTPNKTSIRYTGSMLFSLQQESPPDDADITDYFVVTSSLPYPVAGRSGVPAKLGELRKFLASAKKIPN